MAPGSNNQAPDISKLKISGDTPKSNKSKQKSSRPKAVVDSWEDEDVESSEDDDGGVAISESSKEMENTTEESLEDNEASKNTKDADVSFLQEQSPFYNQQRDTTRVSRLDKRPEKTMATANRLISSALGVRIPKTEEQRQFQKSQMENEKK